MLKPRRPAWMRALDLGIQPRFSGFRYLDPEREMKNARSFSLPLLDGSRRMIAYNQPIAITASS
jgi:hypothetical protein